MNTLQTIAARAAKAKLACLLAGGHAVIVQYVIRLIQANRLEVNQPEIRDLLLKHGTQELYAKIQKTCGQT